MRRRALVFALGGALTSAHGLRAQRNAMPMVGFLSLGAVGAWSHLLATFRQGLAEAGFVRSSSAG
jgi:hypothetical protein